MNCAENQEKDSGSTEIWILRLILYGFLFSFAYGAWELSDYLFESETELGRILNWTATFAGLVILLQLFNALVIDLPRARRRSRFHAQKKADAHEAK